MTTPTSPSPRERLYALLPAIYRLRDATQGEVLRGLLAVVDEQLASIEDDIGALYESWFIETCPEWVVPYLGDLVGVRGLNQASARTRSQRAFVANVLAYRRRKGTAAMLEQLARDVTGWPAHAVEYFLRVGTTQHVGHVRPEHHRTPDLRRGSALGLLGGPFDDLAHTADVRRIGDDHPHVRGRHNLPDVGLHLWRLETAWVGDRKPPVPPPAVKVVEATAEASAATDAGAPGFYRFSPLGQDLPLWNRDRREAEVEISDLSTEATVPGPLRRRALRDALAELRAARELGAKLPKVADLYFGDLPVFALALNGVAVPPEAIAICNLQDWHRPPATIARADGTGDWPIQAAVDPVLGRIALPAGQVVDGPLRVGYYDAHVARTGGGGYTRVDPAPTAAAELEASLAAQEPDELAALPDGSGAATSSLTGGGNALAAALAALAGPGVIELADSRTYAIASFAVPDGARVVVRAYDRTRPVLQAAGPVAITLGAGSLLVLDGVTIAGGAVELHAAGAAAFAAIHSTLVPAHTLVVEADAPHARVMAPTGAPSLTAPGAGDDLLVVVRRSITGPIATEGARLYLLDSLVAPAAGTEPAVDAPAATVTVMATTVLGGVAARRADLVTDSIVTGPLTIERNQEGCLRFSYFPDDVSVAPPAYRCQPALALSTAEAADRPALRLRLAPTFTVGRYGRPGFGQLADTTDVAIRTGASDESEMGAFQLVQAPQRLANLRASLDEYLRFGLEAGIFLAT
ncbi:MAG TPA: phage tail protein [Kofleriaceae bacterium]|nr:phage tail protein [Kofleriaceae bacterium]